MLRLPSVTTNGLIPSHAMKTPLNSPTRAPNPRPTTSPAATTIQSDAPPSARPVITRALATLMTETAVPSDRSKPRVRMTTICADANSSR